MAKVYRADARYLRNKYTGAVFQYNERLVGLADLEEMVANAEGNLERVQTRQPPDTKLSPTKTPEKKEPAVATTAKPATSKPTLAPAEDK